VVRTASLLEQRGFEMLGLFAFKKTEVSVENVKRELERIAFSNMLDKRCRPLPINAVPEVARSGLPDFGS